MTAAPTIVTGMNSDGSLWSETETVQTPKDPAYTPPADCCVQCLITAADVQILYWPVETASPNNLSTANNFSVTAAPPAATPYSYVDQNGMTFVSPSVYVAYRSLGAAENCPAFGPKYFGQGTPTNTTIGYPPDALSTSMCDGPPAGFQLYTAINYTELQYPTGAQTQGTCEWRLGSSGTPRGPYLSIPTDINQVDPAWSSCSGAFEGSFDPPSALRKASAMVAPTPAPLNGPSATPGPSITPVNAPPTATPAPVDPGNSGQQSAPAPPQPAKSSTPNTDPENADPGNSDPGNSDPGNASSGNGDPDNSPASANNGNPAAENSPSSESSQNGAPGSSGSSQNSNPTNPQPANGNSRGDPGNGDPDNESPAQMSALHSILAPSPAAGPQPASGNGGGDPVIGNSASGSSQNSGPANPQPASGNGGTGSTPPPNSVVANGNTIIRNPNGGVVVVGLTVMPGSTAQVAGAPLSVGTDHVVVGGSSYALPAATTAGAVLVGSSPIVKASNEGVVIGSATVPPGVQTAVAGHVVSVGSLNAVVDGSTYALPSSAGAVVQAASAPSPVLVAAQSIVGASNGGIVVGGSTIAPGAQATIAGHTLSVGSSAAVVDGTSYALPTSPGAVLEQAPNLAQNLALSSKITLANGAVITAGGAPATVDGTIIAIPSDDSGLIVNGKTVPLPTAAPASAFTVAGQTFTAAPTGFVLDGQSIAPGGSALTLSGTIISLNPSGTLQIGSSTIPLPSPLPSVFTAAGQTFTAAPTGFVLDGHTIAPGGSALTLSGTVISLGPSGLQIGTSTVPLTPAEASADASEGLGSLILGGYGAGPTGGVGNPSAGLVRFTGAGSRVGVGGEWGLGWLMGVGVGVGISAGVL